MQFSNLDQEAVTSRTLKQGTQVDRLAVRGSEDGNVRDANVRYQKVKVNVPGVYMHSGEDATNKISKPDRQTRTPLRTRGVHTQK